MAKLNINYIKRYTTSFKSITKDMAIDGYVAFKYSTNNNDIMATFFQFSQYS